MFIVRHKSTGEYLAFTRSGKTKSLERASFFENLETAKRYQELAIPDDEREYIEMGGEIRDGQPALYVELCREKGTFTITDTHIIGQDNDLVVCNGIPYGRSFKKGDSPLHGCRLDQDQDLVETYLVFTPMELAKLEDRFDPYDLSPRAIDQMIAEVKQIPCEKKDFWKKLKKLLQTVD